MSTTYITGDAHGGFLRLFDFHYTNETTKADTMVILGDAGINYYLNGRDESRKKLLDKLPLTLLCIHGNHEERPELIDTYVEKEWQGGKIYVEEKHPSILFAKDGEIYDIEGAKILVIGGAYSVDKYYRLAKGLAWYESEQPSDEIKRRVEEKLDSVNWEVDYVFSHTAPLKYEPIEVFLPGIDQSRVDKSTEIWLDKIEEKLKYKKWYCAHYHTEKRLEKIEFMYENYIKFPEEELK